MDRRVVGVIHRRVGGVLFHEVLLLFVVGGIVSHLGEVGKVDLLEECLRLFLQVRVGFLDVVLGCFIVSGDAVVEGEVAKVDSGVVFRILVELFFDLLVGDALGQFLLLVFLVAVDDGLLRVDLLQKGGAHAAAVVGAQISVEGIGVVIGVLLQALDELIEFFLLRLGELIAFFQCLLVQHGGRVGFLQRLLLEVVGPGRMIAVLLVDGESGFLVRDEFLSVRSLGVVVTGHHLAGAGSIVLTIILVILLRHLIIIVEIHSVVVLVLGNRDAVSVRRLLGSDGTVKHTEETAESDGERQQNGTEGEEDAACLLTFGHVAAFLFLRGLTFIGLLDAGLALFTCFERFGRFLFLLGFLFLKFLQFLLSLFLGFGFVGHATKPPKKTFYK